MPGGVKTDVRTYRMYVNGEWVNSKSNRTFPVYDPATEEVIAQVPEANDEDVNYGAGAWTRPVPPRRQDPAKCCHARRSGIPQHR